MADDTQGAAAPDHAGTPGATGEAAWPLRKYEKRPLDRVVDKFIRALVWLGIGPFQIMTVRGRKTGRPYSLPVTLVEAGGRRWLVAPYGPVGWVRNARAAGRVTIRHARTSHDYAILEVGPDEAGPVLKRYVAVAGVTRPYFTAQPESPVAEFVAEASRHPVFELTPLPATAASPPR